MRIIINNALSMNCYLIALSYKSIATLLKLSFAPFEYARKQVAKRRIIKIVIRNQLLHSGNPEIY